MRNQVPPRASPRGTTSDLHHAADLGNLAIMGSLLSERPDGIDQGDPKGNTPLILAAAKGHALGTLFLIGKGANPSMQSVDGGTALIVSSQYGYLDVVKVLLSAGAYMESTTSSLNSTSLHLAAQRGHLEVVRELINAGANTNCRRSDGATPLISAATKGHVRIIRELLRAKADPLLVMGDPPPGHTYSPLDVGAQHGHPGVVRELIEQVGIERCGGPSGGRNALFLAAHEEGLESMALLADAGVVDADTGAILHHTVEYGREKAVKFLIQQRGGGTTDTGPYVNRKDYLGMPTLLKSIYGDIPTKLAQPRIVRLLVDAGADTSSAVLLTGNLTGNALGGGFDFNDTPLAATNRIIRAKKGAGDPEKQKHRLEAIRRLLLQVPAVHAVSWVWPSGVTRNGHAAAEGTLSPLGTTLLGTLPVLRRRARRRGAVLAPLFRWVLFLV